MFSFLYIAFTVISILLAGSTFADPDVSQFKVDSLPGGPPLPPSWAGRLPVPGAELGNALFFWLFQAEDSVYDDNLISRFYICRTGSRYVLIAIMNSLAQRRSWLLVSNRTDHWKRPNFFR